MRAKGRSFARAGPTSVRASHGEQIYIALELAQQAYEDTRYRTKLNLAQWTAIPLTGLLGCAKSSGDAKECVKVRDDQTGKVLVGDIGTDSFRPHPHRPGSRRTGGRGLSCPIIA